MKVLIKTCPSNKNAFVIKTALLARGHEVSLDLQSSFPATQRKSVLLESGASSQFKSRGKDFNKNFSDEFDVVVWLNSEKVKLASDLHADDRAYATFESDIFLQSSNYFLGSNVFWINPLSAYSKANLKPVQLDIAIQLGLKIPATLISNDLEQVKAFFDRDNVSVIVKPFVSPSWKDQDENFYFLPATKIDSCMLNDNQSELESCPIIYQKCIEKAFEVRVTVMGGTVLAAKIQVEDCSAVDWRMSANQLSYSLEKIELPTDIYKKSHAMVKSMGLVYGCIDFAVNTDGEYYFLEVNNAGHFLWKERVGNGLPMLHVFCEFIESKDPNFQWDGNEEYLYHQIIGEAEFNRRFKQEYAEFSSTAT